LAHTGVVQIELIGEERAALFNRQLAPRCTEPIDREDRGDARPRHVGGNRIHPRLEELVQPQLVPERQTKQRRPQLPRPLQPDPLEQDLCDLRVIRGRRDVRGKQLQLVPPRWTPQNRPSIDTSKPATTGVATETVSC